MGTRVAKLGILGPTLVLLFQPVTAKVAPTSLQKLATGSSMIVLGKVQSVIELAGVRVATLSVEEAWKGETVHEIAFLAQSTWTCDVAWAETRPTLFCAL